MYDTALDFEKLYNENMGKVYKLSLGLAGNTNDAEEITQEAFCRAFESLDSFRGESAFSTWMYRITVNTANRYLRQRSKMPLQALTEDLGYAVDEVLDDNPASDPETVLLSKEARYRCLHCITECLPAEQRKIFCLAITVGLPQKMVAEIMECSLSKVKTALFRARQRWFGYMENRCDLIKKSNPCHCSQWVRFGLKQGWFTRQEMSYAPDIEGTMRSLAELKNLKTLRDVYTTLYPGMDDALAKRIREGMRNKEWSVIT
jgi:RNA polymerase sigma-70 factor (ECF subfamily)